MNIKTEAGTVVETDPGEDTIMLVVGPPPYSDNEYPNAAYLTKAQAAELGQYLLTWSQQP